MSSVRAIIGFISTFILILISIYSFTIDNSLTTEVWSFLLLAPLPLAIALAPKNTINWKTKKADWDDDIQEVENENIDPLEFGYDIPIL